MRIESNKERKMTGFFHEQYDRMCRSRGNLSDLDGVIHFVQDCYHLKDWIKNDPIVSKHLKSLATEKNKKNKVENYIKASKFLSVVADIANASKHLLLTKPPRNGDYNIDIIKPPTMKEISKLQRMTSIPIDWCQPFRVRLNNDYITIDRLATGAINEWDYFLEKHKLVDPFGTYQSALFKYKSKKPGF